MESSVKQKVKVVNFGLSSIAKIRKYLTSDATKAICQALAVSKIDNAKTCSSFYNINVCTYLHQLQFLAA